MFNDAITLSCIDQNSCVGGVLPTLCIHWRAISEMIQGSAQFCAIAFSDDDDVMGLARPAALPRRAKRQ